MPPTRTLGSVVSRTANYYYIATGCRLPPPSVENSKQDINPFVARTPGSLTAIQAGKANLLVPACSEKSSTSNDKYVVDDFRPLDATFILERSSAMISAFTQ
ncbi:hypothetical protein VTL71DRAFT_11528 [Oculimacula yallundae]|uniref:Uncharacterized protein n=1 Tax=Oculimacula yallundae TaxID=86028 RepID=A0ABR4CQL1_9HELO